MTERARSTDQLLEAVRRVSNRLRTGLGESPAAMRSARPLAPATTSSLRALQLYSQAVALLDAEVGPRGPLDENVAAGRNPAVAAALLAEALSFDPEFSLAHLARAAALTDATVWDDRAEEVAHLDRAEQTADRSADTERLFIQGRVAFMRASYAGPRESAALLREAAARFEAWARLQPDHLGVLVNLSIIYRRQARGPESWALFERIADLRPNNAGAQVMAAQARIERGDLDGARVLVERVQLMDQTALRPFQSIWLALFPAHEAWLRNDVAEALRLTDEVAATTDIDEQTELHLFSFHVISMYATLGRLDQAERFLATQREGPDHDFRRATIIAQRQDPSALGRFLRARFADMATMGVRVGSFWVEAGLLAQAREAAARVPIPLYLGQVALTDRRYDEAIGHFSQVLRSEAAFGSPPAGERADGCRPDPRGCRCARTGAPPADHCRPVQRLRMAKAAGARRSALSRHRP